MTDPLITRGFSRFYSCKFGLKEIEVLRRYPVVGLRPVLQHLGLVLRVGEREVGRTRQQMAGWVVDV